MSIIEKLFIVALYVYVGLGFGYFIRRILNEVRK